MKTLMVDYTAPGVAAPKAARKNDGDQGLAFTKTQEWQRRKTLTCFGCGKKGHALKDCKSTPKKDRQKIWETKNKGFRKDDAFAMSSTRTKVKKTTGAINQAVKEETSSEEEEDEDEKGAACTKAYIG